MIRELRDMILGNEDVEIKVSAIDALWDLDGRSSVDVIGRALINDRNEDVKIEAALALVAAGDYADAKSFLLQLKSIGGVTPALEGIVENSVT